MNLKKLFATSAILTLAVSTFTPVINSAKANYNSEINSAYSYAYGKNVTTLPTVESAFPMGKAIRSHVAKMISNWALAVLNKQPNEAITPVFTDIAGESEELQGYIKKSAQQGLMGQGITKFMPQQEVTRAQFGTALSRALFGDKYDGGTPYYVNHLENLKKLGVMNDVTNSERPILRYEIWLMLQRAEKLTSKDDSKGLTPEQILGCLAADDYLACVEKAKDGEKTPIKNDEKGNEVVKKGDLKVSIENRTNKIVSIPGTTTAILAKVKFSGSQKISLDSVTVSRVGLGDNSLIRNVWFERNGQRVSNKATVTADNEAVIRFNNGFEVEANETLDFVVELQDSVGGEYAFRIDAIDSSAKDVVIDPDTTSTFRTTEYTVAKLDVGTFNYVGLDSNGTHKFETAEYRINGNNAYEMGRFTVYNDSPRKEDRTVRLQNLNFRNLKGGDLSNFKNWEILRDGKKIPAKVTLDGKYLSFSMSDKIAASRTAIYTVMAVPTAVELESGDEYQLQLRNSGDVVAVEEGKDGVEFRVISTSNYLQANTALVSNVLPETYCGKYQYNAKSTEQRMDSLSINAEAYDTTTGQPSQFRGKAKVFYYDAGGNETLSVRRYTSAQNTEDAVKKALIGKLDSLNVVTPAIQNSLMASCVTEISNKKPVIIFDRKTNSYKWEPVSGKVVTIKGGSLFLTKDVNFPSAITAGDGYSNVVLAKGKMNVAQAVKLGKLVINANTTTTNLNDIIKRAWIVIGGKRYSASEGQSDGIFASTLVFDHDFYIGQGEHDIELVVNITRDAKKFAGNASIQLNPLKWTDFAQNNSNYTNGEETNLQLGKDGIGQLNISDLYIQKSSVGLTKTSDARNINVVVGNSDTKELFAGVVTNTLGKTIYFDDLKLELTAVLAGGRTSAKFADVYVEVDGNQRSSQFPLNVNTTSTSIDIPSIPGSLEPGKSATIKLIGVVNGNLSITDTMDGSLRLTAMVDGNRLESTQETLSTLKIVPTGIVNTFGSSAGKNDSILVDVANADIFSTVFAVRNDSQTLGSFNFVYSAKPTPPAPLNLNSIQLKSLDVMYKRQGDKDTAWTKLTRVGKFKEIPGTYTPGTQTFTAGAGTDREVAVQIQPTAFPVGNYDIKVVGSFGNFGKAGPATTAPVMVIKGTKLGFPSVATYTDITANNQKLIAVAAPILSIKNGTKTSTTNNNSFTLVVTKPNTAGVSIKVTGVTTQIYNNGSRINGGSANYNGFAISKAINNQPSTDSVNTPIEIQIQSGPTPVRVNSITYDVTDADGFVTTYTANGQYGIINSDLLRS